MKASSVAVIVLTLIGVATAKSVTCDYCDPGQNNCQKVPQIDCPDDKNVCLTVVLKDHGPHYKCVKDFPEGRTMCGNIRDQEGEKVEECRYCEQTQGCVWSTS